MAHCPQANARLGSGVAPADALHALGGVVSLAVDGAAANEAADMGAALYAAFTLHRATKGAGATRRDRADWATAGGARVLGLHAIGRSNPAWPPTSRSSTCRRRATSASTTGPRPGHLGGAGAACATAS